MHVFECRLSNTCEFIELTILSFSAHHIKPEATVAYLAAA